MPLPPHSPPLSASAPQGNKCKYAHDLGVERKGPKINIYEDEAEGKEGGMEDWTQEELEKAVAQKHGQENKNNATTIVCKFFIEAVEKRQYGWFWQCPNGGKNCQYRHALPPGFVLPSQMKAMLAEEAEKSRDVTDIIEEERSKCDASTRITEEVFLQWRKRKDEERAKKEEEKKAERAKAGKVSGREMFQTEGFVVTDDDGAAAGDGYAVSLLKRLRCPSTVPILLSSRLCWYQALCACTHSLLSPLAC